MGGAHRGALQGARYRAPCTGVLQGGRSGGAAHGRGVRGVLQARPSGGDRNFPAGAIASHESLIGPPDNYPSIPCYTPAASPRSAFPLLHPCNPPAAFPPLRPLQPRPVPIRLSPCSVPLVCPCRHSTRLGLALHPLSPGEPFPRPLQGVLAPCEAANVKPPAAVPPFEAAAGGFYFPLGRRGLAVDRC